VSQDIAGVHNTGVSSDISDASESFCDRAIVRTSCSKCRFLGLASQYRRSTLSSSTDKRTRNALRDRVNNWPEGFKYIRMMRDVIDLPLRPKMDLPSHKTVVFSAAFTLAGLFYGGMHLLAWNGPFPSRVQRAVWKTSASLIAASGPVVGILWLAACVAHMLASCLPKLVSNFPNVKSVLSLSLFTATVILPISYLMTRTSLVVECFISFASLLNSVLQVPSWSQYFPHVMQVPSLASYLQNYLLYTAHHVKQTVLPRLPNSSSVSLRALGG